MKKKKETARSSVWSFLEGHDFSEGFLSVKHKHCDNCMAPFVSSDFEEKKCPKCIKECKSCTCQLCGKGYKIKKKWRSVVYCSESCQDKMVANLNKGKKQISEWKSSISKCAYCSSEFETKGPKHRHCSIECQRKSLRNHSVDHGRWLILDRDNFKCAYCGRSSFEDDSELHIDHIRPRRLGGSTTADNLITSCQRCNLEKATNIPLSVKELLSEVARRNLASGIEPKMLIKISFKDVYADSSTTPPEGGSLSPGERLKNK